jgi:hypothetical protein
MKTKQLVALLCIVCGLGFGGKVFAQGTGGGGGGFGGGRNFDPEQFKKMVLDNVRDQLEVKDDAEWKVIGDQVQKVFDARLAIGAGGGPGMMRMFRRPNANGGQDAGNGRRGGMAAMLGGQSDPEGEALQKAIDSNAPTAELKAAVAKFVEARKQKQAKLEQDQADLRKLLSVRQEAIAFSLGLL